MAIELISKIKPKNNGDFPMVDAEDVEMPDGTRLSEFKGGVTSVNGQTGDVIITVTNGVSPTVSVSAITGGNRVTITDANGTKTFDVLNGKDGEDGEDGQGSSVTIDTTLSQAGQAADAQAVGVALAQFEQSAGQMVQDVVAAIPTAEQINALIDVYISEALGGDY